MQNETCYQRNPNFIYRKIVDESVLVPIYKDVLADMECIYSLNEVGNFIWEHLEKPATQTDLRSALLNEYDAEPHVLEADLNRFLDEMITLGALCEV